MNRLTVNVLRVSVPLIALLGGATVALFGTSPTSPIAHAQMDDTPNEMIVVSKPPPPVVASDPPQGMIFTLTPDMSASSVAFDTLENEASGGAPNASRPQSLEYLRLDSGGNAYITFDDGPTEAAPGGVMVIEDFLNRSSFDPARDHLITGNATGLVEPKDLVVESDLGVIIVADFAEANVAVFKLSASGNAAPRSLTSLGETQAGEPRRPWGLAFDTDADRLFVGSTDGTVLVFDDYLSSEGGRSPDRVITPTLKGERASANTHDLVYLADEDLLIATDVGSATTADQPGFDTDGKVFLIENASAAQGDTEVKAQLAGPSTMLGNPVGAAFDGSHLFITEKTKDTVLRFDDVLSLSGAVDVAPTGAVTVAKPEAVALVAKEMQRGLR